MSRMLVIDEAYCADQPGAKIFSFNIKRRASVPLSPYLLWACKLALGHCQLPRGKYFDRFRSADDDGQHDCIHDAYQAAAELHKSGLDAKATNGQLSNPE